MATTEELFVSIHPQIYRRNKSATLLGQADLLQVLKHLQNLKVLSRQKNDLRKQLYKLLSSTMTNIKALQEKMPTSKIPKTVQRHETSKPKSEAIQPSKIPFSRKDEIEEELREIHAKLQALNA